MAKEGPSSVGLTPEQINFYESFGFVVLRQAFSDAEMNVMEHEFETLMHEGRNGETFDGRETQSEKFLLEHRSGFKSLMPRVNDATEQLLGIGYIFGGIGANLYVGDTGWHADLGWHYSMLGGRRPPPTGNFYRGVKVTIYPDPVTRDTGCLRVIPASHIMPNSVLDRFAPIHGDVPHNFSQMGP